MNTLGIAVGALGSGIPDGTMTSSLVVIGLTTGDLVAGLSAFVVAMFGVIVVRRLQTPAECSHGFPPVPEPRNDELRKAA